MRKQSNRMFSILLTLVMLLSLLPAHAQAAMLILAPAALMIPYLYRYRS